MKQESGRKPVHGAVCMWRNSRCATVVRAHLGREGGQRHQHTEEAERHPVRRKLADAEVAEQDVHLRHAYTVDGVSSVLAQILTVRKSSSTQDLLYDSHSVLSYRQYMPHVTCVTSGVSTCLLATSCTLRCSGRLERQM